MSVLFEICMVCWTESSDRLLIDIFIIIFSGNYISIRRKEMFKAIRLIYLSQEEIRMKSGSIIGSIKCVKKTKQNKNTT